MAEMVDIVDVVEGLCNVGYGDPIKDFLWNASDDIIMALADAYDIADDDEAEKRRLIYTQLWTRRQEVLKAEREMQEIGY